MVNRVSAAEFQLPGQAWLGDTEPECFREYLRPTPAVRGRWLAGRMRGLMGVEGAEVICIGEKEGLQALLCCQPQPWDTRHFGVACAKLGPMCLPSTLPSADIGDLLYALLAAAVEWARATGTRVLQRRILASRFKEIGVLEDLGFHLVDNVVTLAAPMHEVVRCSGPVSEGFRFRDIQASDRDALASMTHGAFPCSRFVTDRMLDPTKGRALYVAWLDQLIDRATGDDPRRRPAFVVACRGDAPVGYCTYLIDASVSGDVGLTFATIELIVVSPEARGAGLGSALLRTAAMQAAMEGADTMESSTWSAQKAALAANQAARLKVRETLLTYHCYL